MRLPLFIPVSNPRRKGHRTRRCWRILRSVAQTLSKTAPFAWGMKRDLMEILVCPVCKGDLTLSVTSEKEEILEGTLHCAACDHTYTIEDGIPNLLPPDFK